MTLLEMLLRYARMGWRLVPCRPVSTAAVQHAIDAKEGNHTPTEGKLEVLAADCEVTTDADGYPVGDRPVNPNYIT